VFAWKFLEQVISICVCWQNMDEEIDDEIFKTYHGVVPRAVDV
jgi:hypothetical protein